MPPKISLDQYAYFITHNIPYTGYVEGFGYASTTHGTILPKTFGVFNPPARIESYNDTHCISVLVSQVELSPYLFTKSFNFKVEDVTKIITKNSADNIIVYLGKGKNVSVPKNNSTIKIDLVDNGSDIYVNIFVNSPSLSDSKFSKIRLLDLIKESPEIKKNLTNAPLNNNWVSTTSNYSGVVTTIISTGTEITNAAVRKQFKSATKWSEWTNLRDTQQAWRTTRVIGQTGAKTFKILGAGGSILGGLSAGYSTYKVINEYNTGGLANVDGWDVADATIGIAGTASAIALAIGASNPIGWAIIGIGAAGYGAFRAGQFIYESFQ